MRSEIQLQQQVKVLQQKQQQTSSEFNEKLAKIEKEWQSKLVEERNKKEEVVAGM